MFLQKNSNSFTISLKHENKEMALTNDKYTYRMNNAMHCRCRIAGFVQCSFKNNSLNNSLNLKNNCTPEQNVK